MNSQRSQPAKSQHTTFVVFGATGHTGQHFVELLLSKGHTVRALVRTPAKLTFSSPALQVQQGDITDAPNLDALLQGADCVVAMLGNLELQRAAKINAGFVQRLVPAMRRHGVKRFLYQAGALSKPPNQSLSFPLQLIRNTVARSYIAQHEDNEAVMQYLVDAASDIEWMVHRAAIGSDGASRGVLKRSANRISRSTFVDCAAYNYRIIGDRSAVHTCELSCYHQQ